MEIVKSDSSKSIRKALFAVLSVDLDVDRSVLRALSEVFTRTSLTTKV